MRFGIIVSALVAAATLVQGRKVNIACVPKGTRCMIGSSQITKGGDQTHGCAPAIGHPTHGTWYKDMNWWQFEIDSSVGDTRNHCDEFSRCCQNADSNSRACMFATGMGAEMCTAF